MEAFSYVRPSDVDSAVVALRDPHARAIAGGTNLLDLMKGGIEHPSRIVDITRLPLAEITDTKAGGLRIGALVRNSDLASDLRVRERYPLLAQALLAGASPQLRNMATVGGNLMQRTRCYYFADAAFQKCNKRSPGSGCAAREGFNRTHAILGSSEKCVAVNPSDMCVALYALDAIVEVKGAKGSRRIPIGDFHRLPGTTPERDTNLDAGELIVAVELPPSNFSSNAYYVKVRDRVSYAFALVSVAAALRIQNGIVSDARLVIGGVAHKPWRAVRAETQLLGSPLSMGSVAAASAAAVEGAQPLNDNAFKIQLTRASVDRALRTAGGIA
jgi:xanthine dehydrogenase YagS FAD-binding subunit